MNIGIVGFGFVGQAIASTLKDPFLVIDPTYNDSISVDQMLAHNPSFIFLCLPTPTIDVDCDTTFTAGKKCDTSLVEFYVEQFKHYTGVLVLKSTVPPSCIDKLHSIKNDILYWPEFLREKHAEYDIKNPDMIVIGREDSQISHDRAVDLIHFIYDRTNINVQSHGIRDVSLREASLFKYAVNSFLATKVTFMHQLFLWMKANNEDNSWEVLSELLGSEGRVGDTHLAAPGEHGFGFAGNCFPKDTLALAAEARKDGYPLTLLESAIKINDELRKVECDVEFYKKRSEYF